MRAADSEEVTVVVHPCHVRPVWPRLGEDCFEKCKQKVTSVGKWITLLHNEVLCEYLTPYLTLLRLVLQQC